MEKEYILFIDSGIGGLSTLNETIKILPANYIFFADVKNSPYGIHTKNDIFHYLSNIIDNHIIKFNIKIVVLACNTATTCCIDKLRMKYSKLQFIGTEPALKFASKQGFKSILSVTTTATSKQEKYKLLIKNIDTKVKTIAMTNLAKNIENFEIDNTFFNKVTLFKDLFFILNHAKHQDCIVLGCTHYVYIKNILQQFTSQKIIDGNTGVANQTKKMFEFFDMKSKIKSSILFDCSHSTKFAKQNYKKILRQILANLQKL